MSNDMVRVIGLTIFLFIFLRVNFPSPHVPDQLLFLGSALVVFIAHKNQGRVIGILKVAALMGAFGVIIILFATQGQNIIGLNSSIQSPSEKTIKPGETLVIFTPTQQVFRLEYLNAIKMKDGAWQRSFVVTSDIGGNDFVKSFDYIRCSQKTSCWTIQFGSESVSFDEENESILLHWPKNWTSY